MKHSLLIADFIASGTRASVHSSRCLRLWRSPRPQQRHRAPRDVRGREGLFGGLLRGGRRRRRVLRYVRAIPRRNRSCADRSCADRSCASPADFSEVAQAICQVSRSCAHRCASRVRKHAVVAPLNLCSSDTFRPRGGCAAAARQRASGRGRRALTLQSQQPRKKSHRAQIFKDTVPVILFINVHRPCLRHPAASGGRAWPVPLAQLDVVGSARLDAIMVLYRIVDLRQDHLDRIGLLGVER